MAPKTVYPQVQWVCMAITETVRQRTRTHPRVVTAVLSLVGYALVIGSFVGVVPFPELGQRTVILFGDLIAVINTAALTALLVGWRFIKRGDVRKHRLSMLTSFSLIMLFLVVYVWKQAGGFTKEFVVSQGQFLAEYATLITYTYWGMLAIHVLLSIVAVPVVLHAVVLGLTHSPSELGDTTHPRVGKAAVAAWSVSLVLGIITYLMLNHVYGWEALRLAR
jgi:putative membrane protein